MKIAHIIILFTLHCLYVGFLKHMFNVEQAEYTVQLLILAGYGYIYALSFFDHGKFNWLLAIPYGLITFRAATALMPSFSHGAYLFFALAMLAMVSCLSVTYHLIVNRNNKTDIPLIRIIAINIWSLAIAASAAMAVTMTAKSVNFFTVSLCLTAFCAFLTTAHMAAPQTLLTRAQQLLLIPLSTPFALPLFAGGNDGFTLKLTVSALCLNILAFTGLFFGHTDSGKASIRVNQ